MQQHQMARYEKAQSSRNPPPQCGRYAAQGLRRHCYLVVLQAEPSVSIGGCLLANQLSVQFMISAFKSG